MPVWQVCILAVTMLALTAQAPPAEDAVDWPARFEAKLAELRAQGEPVTMDEIMARREPVPDEENSALVFLQAFAAEEAVAFDLPVGGNAHYGFATVVGARQPEPVLFLVRASVEANAEALRLIHHGARLTRGAYPVALTRNPYEILLEHLGKLRNAARLCLREAAVRAHDGDGAAAADSLLAVRRLSASLGDCVFLIDALVRMAVDGIFCEGLERALGLGEMPLEKLEALAREAEAEAAELSLVNAMRSERAAGHYVFTAPPDEVRRFAATSGLTVPQGALKPQRRAQDALYFYERMEEAIRVAALPDREKLSEAERMRERLVQLPQTAVLTRTILPAVSRAFEEEVKGRTRLTVARAALAVEQWRLKNGAWPESLDALVPDLLDAVPQDPFADGPVGYVQAAGGAIVYSVGPNGQYDGGHSIDEARAAGQPDAYDLTFHLLDFSRRGTRQGDLEDESLAGGMTMLHAPAQAGHAALVERLLARGANVHAWDENGRTPLHLAAQAGHREVAELLLEHGADVNAADLQGHTPTGLAAEAGHEELAEFLREHGGVE